MIRIKAIAAIALAGLGGATMGTDVYLSSHASSPPRAVQSAAMLPVTINAPRAPVLDHDAVVTLDPVVIYARNRSAHAVRHAKPMAEPRKPPELAICSDWRSLESGPANRGVRLLCIPGSSTTGP